MPRPYSTDLRERALAAYEAGEGSQAVGRPLRHLELGSNSRRRAG